MEEEKRTEDNAADGVAGQIDLSAYFSIDDTFNPQADENNEKHTEKPGQAREKAAPRAIEESMPSRLVKGMTEVQRSSQRSDLLKIIWHAAR